MSLTELPGAIVVLLLAATVTPGPNNLLMLRIGLEHGQRAVLAPATGVVLGGVAMLLLGCAGLARAFAAHPWLRAATAICGAGRWGTRLAQAALRQVLFATESLIVTGPALYLAQTDAPFASGGRLADEAARGALRQILQALAHIMRSRA